MTNEKNNFFLGLAVGIAAMSLIGMVLMGMGGFKKTDSEFTSKDDKTVVANNDDSNNNPTPTPSANNDNTAPAAKADIAVASDDRIRGNKNAPVTIIEFSDLQCPFCVQFHKTMQQVMTDYPDKVRWVFKHFPLSQIHPYATNAAIASECAGDQNKFWEYVDAIYADQSKLNDDFITQTATDLKLNMTKFNSCLSTKKYASKVEADQALGSKNGINGTPGSFINGEPLKGAYPYETVKAMIDKALAGSN
jgi:protein-disulfide isomerase